jgi:hypothetical protein
VSTMPLHRMLLEGLPIAVLLGATGIVTDVGWLAWAVFLPFVLWLGTAIAMAVENVQQARQDGSNAPAAALRGAFTPLLSVATTYWKLGLWRGRGVYDAAAVFALGAGTWWICLYVEDDPKLSAARWICIAPLVMAGVGCWLRWRARRSRSGPPPLLTEVMLALDSWEHKRRRTDELSYENAIAARLRGLGFDAAQGERLEDGREADIVVRPKGQIGGWDWRDVMIEMKAHLTTTHERDRAVGQLETYAETWPGAIVIMICGDYRRDLLPPLQGKVASLCKQGRSAAMVVKGRSAGGRSSA